MQHAASWDSGGQPYAARTPIKQYTAGMEVCTHTTQPPPAVYCTNSVAVCRVSVSEQNSGTRMALQVGTGNLMRFQPIKEIGDNPERRVYRGSSLTGCKHQGEPCAY